MNWQILIFGYIIFATASFLLRRTLAKSIAHHNKLINAFFFAGTLYPIGLLIAAFTSPDLSIGWYNFFFAMIGSCLFPLVMILSFKSNEKIDAGLYGVINNVAPIVTIVLAVILLDETLNFWQILGSFLIIFSAFLVSAPSLLHHRKSNLTGIMIAFLSVIILGAAVVFERWMLTRIDFGAYLVYGWGAQTLWMVILAWPDRKNLKLIFAKKNFDHVIWYALTNTFKGVCFVGAVKLASNVSVVMVTSSFTAVTIVLAAYFLLKERSWLWLKIFSAFTGACGLIILNI